MRGGLRKTGIVFEIAILCLPKAPGCQLLEAATSAGCRFSGSSQTSNMPGRVWTLHCFWFDVSGVECPLRVISGLSSMRELSALREKADVPNGERSIGYLPIADIKPADGCTVKRLSVQRPFSFSGINFLEPLHALIEFAGARLEIVGASTGNHVAVGVGVPRGAAAN